MIFRYPIMLLLLLLIPVLLYLRYGKKRKSTVRHSDVSILKGIPPGIGVMLQPLFPILYTAGLCFLVLAMSRPQRGLAESRVHTEGVDMVLLVDVSPSMRAEDFSTTTKRLNRLDAAKEVIDQFIRNRPNDRLGLVAFAAMAYAIAPLTLDHGWLLQQVERLESGTLGDGTAIGDAVASAINRLRDSEAKTRLVILLTDGMNNSGKMTPENAAQAAKALDIKVYTIGAGKEGIVRMPVQDPFGGTHYVRQRSEIDEATLTRISDSTGAKFFRAEDLDALQSVYDEIDKMEKTEITVEQFTRFQEKFQPFVLAALLCLTLERLFSVSRWGRIP